MLEKVKGSIADFAKYCVTEYGRFQKYISDYADICAAENDLYAISSGAFVRAFSDTALRIAYCRSVPNRDTFLGLADIAKRMLLRGDSQADVLLYFDEILEKEM